MFTNPKYLVLDLSWLRSVSGRAASAILAGFTPVMIDTLIYETATSSRNTAWEEALKKLAPLAPTTHIWRPVSELLVLERDSGLKVDVPMVDLNRRLLSGALGQFSPRLDVAQQAAVEAIADNRQTASTGSLAELIDYIRKMLQGSDIDAAVRNKKLREIVEITQKLCSAPELVMKVHSFVTRNARDVAPMQPIRGGIWYREAQGILAYAMDACRGQRIPGKDELPNWKHDLDYAIMGSMTGYLATKDQRTAFAAACMEPNIQLCGLTALPPSEEIATAAFFRWLQRGSEHGQAVGDWLSAEQDLLDGQRFRWEWTQ